MSRYVEPRFETLGNTFIDDPSDSGDQQTVSGLIERRHSFSHRAVVHDMMQEAPGGRTTVRPAARGPPGSPPSSARPRPSSLSDLGPTPCSPSQSGGSGESLGASAPSSAGSAPKSLGASAPTTDVDRRRSGASPLDGSSPLQARAQYDSSIAQANVESATATPDRRELPGGTARHLQPQARGRRRRGGKARHLYDSSLSQASTEGDVASPGRHSQAWGDGAPPPSPPMSPDVRAPQEVLIADLLRTGGAAMQKAASLASRMKVGDTPKRRGSTGLFDSFLGGVGSSGGASLGGGTPLGYAAASPTPFAAPAAPPQGTPPSPLPLLGAAVVPR